MLIGVRLDGCIPCFGRLPYIMVEIYCWLLFVLVCLIVLLPIFIFHINLRDDHEGAGNLSYLTSLSCLLSGLIPVVGGTILSLKWLYIILVVFLSVIILYNFVLCIAYYKQNKHFFFSLLLAISISLVPFIIRGKMMMTETIDFLSVFDKNFPMILFSFWLPLLVIAIIVASLLRNRETIKFVNNNDSYRNLGFEDVLIRKSIENLATNTIGQYETIQRRMDDISITLKNLRVNQSYRRSNFSEIKDLRNDGMLLQKILDEVRHLKLGVSQITVSEVTVTNQVLIRELTHFIATPLATIDTSCKLVEGIIQNKDKRIKILEYVNRIESAVNICRGILATYREIFIMTKSEDKHSLSELIQESFDLLNDKNLSLTLEVLDYHDNLGNYYIISTLLPLMTNAVTAATDGSMIEIKETNNRIIISNDYEGEIDITDFEKEGYSSKPDHKGMGLYTVRHLLARRNMKGLIYYIDNNRIYFEIPVCTNEKE